MKYNYYIHPYYMLYLTKLFQMINELFYYFISIIQTIIIHSY
jgi:hypothetical protein